MDPRRSIRDIPADLVRVQIAASDPAVSAWVAANAGSGKTHVLAQRVIRLLLAGVHPAKILCITFTKAAAANMANRIFDELRRWTALDDGELDQAIESISGLPTDRTRRALARRLFAMALETPGGLKVQTIHAFCTRLLQQFPFEANVAARFSVLDERAEAQLLNDITFDVLLEASVMPDAPLGRALATAITAATDQTFKEALGEAIRKRHEVRAWIDHAGNIEQAIARLCNGLGIAVDDTIEQVEKEIVEGPLLPSSEWKGIAEICKAGSVQDHKQCARFVAAAAAVGSERVETYLEVFFVNNLEPRANLVTKAIANEHPALAQRLIEEQERLQPLNERRKALACRNRTAALLTIADAAISRYQAAKNRRGLLDYDDLIDKTLALLGEDRAAWVHYKLDQGIDHVLIDEAQDTSSKQWEIIHRLSGEFFVGAGARTVRRTIFAVGDEKQSIFSFQGAAPHAFAEMREWFQRAHATGGLPFVPLTFKHSFRSGANVLGAVDAVFAREPIHASVTSDPDGIPPHIALPDAAPGVVEIWETIKPQDKREIEAWDAPFDDLAEKSPQARLAAKLASNVKRWIKQGARAGDVLILVRQRGPLFDAIIRALKEAQIAVAGADRLVLTEHIAVMDLMALADALLLPEDDLALASVLKSPLFGLSDEDLFEIGWQRRGPLRAALRDKAALRPHFADAAAKLDRFAGWAQDLPFTFYARILGADRGRKRFLARLGHEADDAIDEFLNLALDYERRETPSLQGFISWLRGAQTDVKRDMEIRRDEVRVMTVHGAKGLEATIVVLADTTTAPSSPGQRQPRLIPLPRDGTAAGPTTFAWAGVRATDSVVVSGARECLRREAEDEYRRLLYVAMTRAIDRLVVCGADGERSRPDGCWWNLVHAVLQPLSTAEPAEDGEGQVWRYRRIPVPAGAEMTHVAEAEQPVQMPPWLERAAPSEVAAVVQVSPSSAYDEIMLLRAGADANRAQREKSKARGMLMHRLLQSLPDIAPTDRASAGKRYLARNAGAFSATECETMVKEVCSLLADPRFSELFLPGSRAEVPVVGRISGIKPTITVSGLVDRLVVTDSAVLLADYKTNRPAPQRIEQVPQPYLAQLALYRAVLRQLYPAKTIRAALIWTDLPELMDIPSDRLDAALAAVTSS